MPQHSKEKRERYAKGLRYSEDATHKKRQNNCLKWHVRAVEKYGQAFDYASALVQFQTQKKPKVTITCKIHKHPFAVTPDRHLQNEFGGCDICATESRVETRQQSDEKKFLAWFNLNHSERLKVVSKFLGMTQPIDLLCKFHKTTESREPSVFMHQTGWGCSLCAKESTGQASRLKLEDVKNTYEDELPENIKIVDIIFDEISRQSLIKIECSSHGEQTVRAQSLKRSKYICKVCSEGKTGFASNRLQQLMEDKEVGSPTRLAVMEMEVFGIRAMKVGVTTRSLEERYLWYLKDVFFEVTLNEIDAYVLENQIRHQFREHTDLRIIKKGMRDGSRWSGDTEFYWFREKDKIIEFIKSFIARLELEKPDYENELGQMIIPNPFPKRRGRAKGVFAKPMSVVGVDPNTNKVVARFASMTDAKKAGYRNVSLVLSPNSSRQLAGGIRWFKAEEFDEENIPLLKPKQFGLPVYCVELDMHFLSQSEAERQCRAMGYKVSGSKIAMVLKGKRAKAGDLSWRRSELNREQIQRMKQK
jgi:hypothetical protein